MSAWMRLNDENISTSKRHKENAAKSEKKLNKKPFGGATRNLKIPPIFTIDPIFSLECSDSKLGMTFGCILGGAERNQNLPTKLQ